MRCRSKHEVCRSKHRCRSKHEVCRSKPDTVSIFREGATNDSKLNMYYMYVRVQQYTLQYYYKSYLIICLNQVVVFWQWHISQYVMYCVSLSLALTMLLCVDSDGSQQQLGGCLRDFRNKPYPVRVKVEYYSKILTVRTAAVYLVKQNT